MDEGLVPFATFFPEQAARETRSFTTRGDSVLAGDEYGLLESYCADPACACRRVMLNVVSRQQRVVLAAISFGFDRDSEFAGPFLDPLNRQSASAGNLLAAVREVLADPVYVARLEAHYYQVKGATADQNHPREHFLTHAGPSQQWARTRFGERMRSGRPASVAARATMMTAA